MLGCVALVTGCADQGTASPVRTDPPVEQPADRAIDPAEPIDAIAEQAVTLVEGSVVAADPELSGEGPFEAQSAVIAVRRVLKGDAAAGEITVAKPESGYFLTADPSDPSPQARTAGLFALDGEGHLVGYVGVYSAEAVPQFERVLAGLPADVPAPTTAQVGEWAAAADTVVIGWVDAVGQPVEFSYGPAQYAKSGTLHVDAVLAGELADAELAVVRGPSVFEVGAKWGFRTDNSFASGVFFLDTSSSPAVVLNGAAPWQVSERAARQALDAG